MKKNCPDNNRFVAFNGRSMKKKTLYNKEKYEDDQKRNNYKNKNLLSRSSNNYFNDILESHNTAVNPNGPSLCQSIALGSMMAQNFLKNTY